MRPIGAIYENEAWLEPLFGALDAVEAPYERLFAVDATFDPAGPGPRWSLAVNKVSPSSYLRDHAAAIPFELGPDGSGIVQEYLEPQDGAIVRIEFLDGEFLYAISITNDRDQDFNLCPADICQVPDPLAEFDNNPLDAPAKKPLQIEAFDPPGEMVDAVLRIAHAGKLDVGGVEYLVAARDGLPYVYDINALSNFVTDAPSLVGFDPHARFARWLVERASRTSDHAFEEVLR